jgi:hypothetical protein
LLAPPSFPFFLPFFLPVAAAWTQHKGSRSDRVACTGCVHLNWQAGVRDP